MRSVRNGQRRVLRLQRRLWLAELALWPTAILLAVLAAAGAWLLWRRTSQRRSRGHDTVAPTAPPVDAAPVVAGATVQGREARSS